MCSVRDYAHCEPSVWSVVEKFAAIRGDPNAVYEETDSKNLGFN